MSKRTRAAHIYSENGVWILSMYHGVLEIQFTSIRGIQEYMRGQP